MPLALARARVNSAFVHSCIIQRKLSVLLLCCRCVTHKTLAEPACSHEVATSSSIATLSLACAACFCFCARSDRDVCD